MAAFIIYIIRWGVVLTLLYSLYGLLLRRETLHGFNRGVLLLILLASMLLPLCRMETSEPNYISQGRQMLESQIVLEEPLVAVGTDYETKGTPVAALVAAAYAVGLAACWLRYLWLFASLLFIIRRGKRADIEGVPRQVHVITHPDINTPSSWMHWIILNPTDGNTRAVVNHELAHIRLRHSWDMLLCEFTCRMLWFVPFVWMLRQDLRDVHEYQADRCVLTSGITDEEYQLLLIRKATGKGLLPVANAFNQSPIKRRFKMMYAKPSRRWMALKAVYLLPLCALALLAFATPRLDQTIVKAAKQVESSFERPEPTPPPPAAAPAAAALLPKREVQSTAPSEKPTATPAQGNYPKAIVRCEALNLTQAPQFPGGMPALRTFVQQHIAQALAEGAPVAGKRAYVQFRIGKDATIDDIALIKGDEDTYIEAVKIVEQMPRWTPARKDGELVDAYFVLTLDFSNK